MSIKERAIAAYQGKLSGNISTDKDVLCSPEYAALLSLNNACNCRIQRRKCKKQFRMNLTAAGVIPTECFEESDEHGSRIPNIADIYSARDCVWKTFGSIPEPLDALSEKASLCRVGSGKTKVPMKERCERVLFAATLCALADLESAYRLGAFPIRKYEEARVVFYHEILGKDCLLPAVGSGGTFELAQSAGKDVSSLLLGRLTALLERGFFATASFIEQYDGTLPTKESAAWWACALLNGRGWLHWKGIEK